MPSFGKHPYASILLKKSTNVRTSIFKNIWCRIWRAINRINISHMAIQVYIYIYINNPLKPSYCDTSWGDSKLELFCFPDIFRVSANGWQSLSFFWEGSFWFKGESDASPTTQLASQQFFYKTLATWSWFSSFFGTDPIGCRFGTALSSRSGGVVWVIFVIFLIIIHH